jgi:hypothetical protein
VGLGVLSTSLSLSLSLSFPLSLSLFLCLSLSLSLAVWSSGGVLQASSLAGLKVEDVTGTTPPGGVVRNQHLHFYLVFRPPVCRLTLGAVIAGATSLCNAKVVLEFDGVQAHAQVYFDGVLLGKRFLSSLT